jgi:hypothetical protein
VAEGVPSNVLSDSNLCGSRTNESAHEGLQSGNIAETCRKYEIAPNLYYRWKDEVEAGAKAALGGRSAAARPCAIAFDGSSIWVANEGDSTTRP